MGAVAYRLLWVCVCVWLVLSAFGLVLIVLFVYRSVVFRGFVLVIGKLPRFG